MFNTDRIKATHTGSLPRPEALTKLMYEIADGKDVDADELRRAESVAVGDVVAQQQEAGIAVVSDGEMSKPGFVNYVADRIAGFGGAAPPFGLNDMLDFPELLGQQFGGEAGSHIKLPICQGELSYQGQDAVASDIATLKAAIGDDDVQGFIPAISPGFVSLFLPNEYYSTYEEYLAATAAALRCEYRAIVESGFILQIDSPDLAIAPHAATWTNILSEIGYDRYLEMHLGALSDALSGLPADRIRLHTCWGNYVGPHHQDVPLRDIVEPLLRLPVGGIAFEAANPAHAHEWQVFETVQVPDDKVLLPGVIDTKSNVVEHPELVAERICRIADLVGKERVVPGTDCGFGTFVGFGLVLPKIAWMKLANLGTGAALATERLWS